DPRQRGEIERALTAFARAQGVSPSSIRVLRGRFDYQQLDSWFSAASQNAIPVAGALYTDLDEANNRVLVAVENANAVGLVRVALATSNIPAEALAIEVREPIYAVATLRDRVRPIVGGVQIHFGNYLCSIGFNVRD